MIMKLLVSDDSSLLCAHSHIIHVCMPTPLLDSTDSFVQIYLNILLLSFEIK